MTDRFFDGEADRRGFFHRLFGQAGQRVARAAEAKVVQQRFVRPPGAVPELAFLASCTRCGQCSEACPHDVIRTVSTKGGLATATPYLDPARLPCEVCEGIPCAAACPTGALLPPDSGWPTHRIGRVRFEPDRCIVFRGHPCRVCVDACPVGETALTLDGEGRPVLRAEGCVGCGHCVRDCITTPSAFTFLPWES